MATITELETAISDLKQEEKALQLKLKAVRGKIAAAQLELMGARKAAEATAPAAAARDRSRSRGSDARGSSDSDSSSDDNAGIRDDAAVGFPIAAGADDVSAAGVAPPPEPVQVAGAPAGAGARSTRNTPPVAAGPAGTGSSASRGGPRARPARAVTAGGGV